MKEPNFETRTQAEPGGNIPRRFPGLALLLAMISLLILAGVFFTSNRSIDSNLAELTIQARADILATDVARRATAEAEALQREATALTQVDLLATELARQSKVQATVPLTDTDRQTPRVDLRSTAEAMTQAQIAQLERQNELQLARQLAAQSLTLMDQQLDLSLLLALEANLRSDTAETRSSLLAGLAHHPQLDSFLHGHHSPIWSLAFSPNAQILAVGKDGGKITLWDRRTGQARSELLTGDQEMILSLAFSPNGQIVAAGGDDGTITLWNTDSGQSVGRLLTDQAGRISSLAFSPDGQILASGDCKEVAGEVSCKQGHIRLWDVAGQQPLEPSLSGHVGRVSSLAFSADGQILASGSSAGDILLWDLVTNVPIGEPLTRHTGAVLSLAFSPDDQTLVSLASDDNIFFWNVANSQLQAIIQNHPARYKAPLLSMALNLGLSPDTDNQVLASGYRDGAIILWNVADIQPGGPVKSHLVSHTGPVRTIAFSPDGQLLASGGEDKHILLWNVASSEPVGDPLTGHTGRVSSLAFNANGQTLASGSCGQVTGDTYCNQGEILLWNIARNEAIGSPLSGHNGTVLSLAFSPDGQTLASGGCGQVKDNIYCDRGEILLWLISGRTPISKSLTGHSGAISSLAFSPDGETLASAGPDETITLWDLKAGQPRDTLFAGHDNRVLSLAFSPDGQSLAAGNLNKSIRLWDIGSKQTLGQSLSGHTGAVWSVAFSPDGRLLASGGEDKRVILWDIARDQPLGQPLTGDNRQIWSVAFSPDGETLASGSTGGSIILWDLNIETWQSQACRRANRNLTQEEWDRFIGSEKTYRLTCPRLPPGES